MLPSSDEIFKDTWVAVAYTNGWYPGVVLSQDISMVEINFMWHDRNMGTVSWPSKKDIVIVDSNQIFFKIKTAPEPTSQGCYLLKEAEHIQELFSKYCELYF